MVYRKEHGSDSLMYISAFQEWHNCYTIISFTGLRRLPPPRGAVWEPVSCFDELAEPREDRWSAVGAGAGVLAVAAVNGGLPAKWV